VSYRISSGRKAVADWLVTTGRLYLMERLHLLHRS